MEVLSDGTTLGNRLNKDKPEQSSKKQRKGIKKKIRRPKKIKNTLRKFKIYYQNVRGLKSKVDSLDETIEGYEPTLICLLEIHLTKEEQIQIPGHKIFRNDGTTNNRCILIAIKEKLKTIGVEVNREDAIVQTLWVLLSNQSQNGSHIWTQKKINSKSELKKLYENISDQVEILNRTISK